MNDGYDLDRIAAAVDINTRLVYLSNPNNPTGTILDADAIDRFLDQLPSHVITVLDEAYYDYASYFAAERSFDYSHALDYVRQGRRVVALRTFSKSHGLAGVRVGYGMGPAELMGYFARLKPAFMVSSLGRGGGAGRAGGHRPHSASLGDECRRSEVADAGHRGHGNSRDSDMDELPLLPGWRRCGQPLPHTSRERHHRSSHEWIVGSAGCLPRHDWHTRAEPAVSGRAEASPRASSGLEPQQLPTYFFDLVLIAGSAAADDCAHASAPPVPLECAP